MRGHGGGDDTRRGDREGERGGAEHPGEPAARYARRGTPLLSSLLYTLFPLPPLFRRPILLFSPLPSPWFSPQTLILLHIYLYAPPSPHVFKVAPLWIMSHVHVCVFPLSIYTHVSLLSNKWILCWRGWRCLPELCFEARDTDEKIRKVQLVRIGFQELPIARTISLLIDYRSSYNTSSRVYTWYKNFVEFQVWSYGKNSRGWMNECLYES